MQFMITAYDGTDSEAMERRMKARPLHLANITKVKDGKVVCAGGILNEEGAMTGSFLIMDFPSREAFDAYLSTEPYNTGGVWQEIKVETCHVAIMNDEPV